MTGWQGGLLGTWVKWNCVCLYLYLNYIKQFYWIYLNSTQNNLSFTHFLCFPWVSILVSSTVLQDAKRSKAINEDVNQKVWRNLSRNVFSRCCQNRQWRNAVWSRGLDLETGQMHIDCLGTFCSVQFHGKLWSLYNTQRFQHAPIGNRFCMGKIFYKFINNQIITWILCNEPQCESKRTCRLQSADYLDRL